MFDKSIETHLAKAIKAYKKFKKMYKLDTRYPNGENKGNKKQNILPDNWTDIKVCWAPVEKTRWSILGSDQGSDGIMTNWLIDQGRIILSKVNLILLLFFYIVKPFFKGSTHIPKVKFHIPKV